MKRLIPICLLTLTIVIAGFSGCGADSSPRGMLARVNASNIQRLANLYNRYQSEHRWVGPTSEEEFREYVEKLPAARLEMLGVDPNDIDGLFRSERDGENYVFRYRVQGSAMGKVDPVVFEQTGVNGKRMVGFTNKPPVELDEADYNDHLAGKFVSDKADRGTDVPGLPQR